MKPYEKLKEIRLSQKISTYELSERTGIPQSTISKMENGKRKIETESLELLAKALNVSVSTFFDNDLKHNESKEKDYSLTIKEQENIDKEAQKILNDMTLSFSKNKDILTEEDYFAIEMALKSSLEAIKIKNKKKFTPKKFR
ncbi:helix-turn-helix domain-containing protein [Clostridium perfringens]|uniref:helix-turn-helix domain-containing protein n=1 Tax=Clostridium perfringens TaxID=1502 RepID=UPI0013E406F1|nr:helix-turn-helix transcriptional regulator [Clostridium perfringens]MDU2175706.1 helix-turn-helix transcriptional regulator [Clostridioides difficile]ELC8330961.1 helix-turn-helix transcriptional regulator [Clostridium perfringens]MDU2657021.1 helix-turn-helix transcriptional regulator [Clostridium perfringens]MDU5659576.1 helix-turn-helix transcriptional regulator [Clostridium perfringens]MDU7549184.1 helix-turn-helix transcriptional regulator [Clostridium perfringens]